MIIQLNKTVSIVFMSLLIFTFFFVTNYGIGHINVELDVEEVAFTSANGAFDIWVENDIAYVTCGYQGLRIFNISDYTNIWEVKHLEQSYSEGFAHQIVVKNKIAYIGNGRGGLWIINVTKPLKPEIILDFVGPGLYGWDVKIKENILFLASGTPNGNFPGFAVINITIPKDPSLITIFNSSIVTDIELINDNLYFVSKFGGVTIVNISNASQPTLINEYNPPDITREVIGNGILINDDLAFSCVYSLEIGIFNISNPLNIMPLDIDLSEHISPFHAANQGNLIFFTDIFKGLYVYDFTVPEKPVQIGYLLTRSSPYIPRFFQDTFYLTYQGNGFAIHNISKKIFTETVISTETTSTEYSTIISTSETVPVRAHGLTLVMLGINLFVLVLIKKSAQNL
ncbi:MAG: LVIVD repeat-containing protein [Candidatus Thorarchaeota archaeon]